MKLDWFVNGGDELFVGRAGYMCAILWMQKELNMAVSCSKLNGIFCMVLQIKS